VTFLIDRPHCGAREATEFSLGGDDRRRAGLGATDGELVDALSVRRNVHGWQTERWRHDAGCRSWLLVEPETGTDGIRRVRPEDRDPGAVAT
jgi:methylglutamate dehydrogenase subunit B